MPSTEQFGGALLEAPDKLVARQAKTLLARTPTLTRYVLKSVPGLPGKVLDGASVLAAKDRGRALAEVVGGGLGAMAGGVGGPVGAVVGSAAGQKAASAIYDHKDEIASFISDQGERIRRNVLNDVRGYTPPYPIRHRY